MLRDIFKLVLCLCLCLALYGQNPVTISVSPPNPVVSFSGSAQGAAGATTLYYWIATRYPGGLSLPYGPVTVMRTVGQGNLSVSNFVRISWTAVPGATGYYVVRSTGRSFPGGGACTGCVVVANTALTSFDDIGGGTTNWPPAGVAFSQAAIMNIGLDNTSRSTPFVRVAVNGTANRMVLADGAFVYGLDLQGTGPYSGADIRGQNGGTLTNNTLGRWQVSNGLNVAGTIIGASLDVLSNAAVGQWSVVRGSGLRTMAVLEDTLFANLGAVVVGGIMSCSDCQVTGPADNTCAAGGGGALVVGIGAAWRCFNLQNVP